LGPNVTLGAADGFQCTDHQPAAVRAQGRLDQFGVHAPQPITVFNDHDRHVRVSQQA
jgi:hypothetical protein